MKLAEGLCLFVCLNARTVDTPRKNLKDDVPMPMQATLLNYGSQHGYGRCSVASQGSLDEDDCDSSEELIGNVAGGGNHTESHTFGGQTKILPIGGNLGPTTSFRLHFLGSVEVEEEGGRKRRKRLKKHMVEEAVTKIKVRLALSPTRNERNKRTKIKRSIEERLH